MSLYYRWYNTGMADFRISVRELVEFILRSGDLDNRTLGSPDDAMLAGANMHRKLQAAAGDSYRAEVPLSLTWVYSGPEGEASPGTSRTSAARFSDTADEEELIPLPSGEAAQTLSVEVQGRADGIYRGVDPLDGSETFFVDEIKTTYRRLGSIRQPLALHLAQAKCYAYILAVQEGLESVGVRMSYCSLITEEIRYFHEIFDFEEISMWFAQLMEAYRPWAQFRASWAQIRTDSIRAMDFPFEYRPGQRDLAAAVYRTIVLRRKLFLEAPTGTGKTITTLFPAIKAVGEGKAERIFYLTARTITRTAAQETLSLLRGQRIGERAPAGGSTPEESSAADSPPEGVPAIPPSGRASLYEGLRLKSVTLTAREKICILEKPDCNPESCPRAKGHYSRVNAAMYDLLTHEDAFTRESICACAARHEVCPFELGLDLSLYSDVIIGDYNYLFDPRAGLRRFFGESGGAGKDEFIFLVDEAHNLVDRGREMYSAELVRDKVQAIRRQVKEIWPKLNRKLGRCAKELLNLRRSMTDAALPSGADCGEEQAGGPPVPDPGQNWAELKEIDALGAAAEEACSELASVLSKERIAQQSGSDRTDPLRAEKRAVWNDVLEFYYDLDHFLSTLAAMDEHYVIYAQLRPGRDIMVKLFCTDPSRKLSECMGRGRASILFSATLLPITYYKALLGGTGEDYEIYAHSVFDPKRLGLFLVRDLTSRYRDRTPENYERIAACIRSVIRERHGNYLVFLPSYAFLEEIASRCPEDAQTTILRQESGMSEPEREAFLQRFSEVRDDRSLVGLCVMGGIFSEGIDLRSDRLIGVIVVGTGLPGVGAEREILRGYFDRTQDRGYDYAYRCPGMNKVQQAAGRVIRTKEDVGIVVLIDGRFALPATRRLFPREWENAVLTDSKEVGHLVERFWDEWL